MGSERAGPRGRRRDANPGRAVAMLLTSNAKGRSEERPFFDKRVLAYLKIL